MRHGWRAIRRLQLARDIQRADAGATSVQRARSVGKGRPRRHARHVPVDGVRRPRAAVAAASDHHPGATQAEAKPQAEVAATTHPRGMSRDAAIATGCLVLALGCVLGALRCLADRLLPSAAFYTMVAVVLVGGAAKVALDSL